MTVGSSSDRPAALRCGGSCGAGRRRVSADATKEGMWGFTTTVGIAALDPGQQQVASIEEVIGSLRHLVAGTGVRADE